MDNYKIKVIKIFVVLIFISEICNSQSKLDVYGDTAYTNTFSVYGSGVRYKNIFESGDSVIVRAWDAGKAYTLSYVGDSFIGEKTIYILSNPHRNPYRKRVKSKWTMVYESNHMSSVECDEIYRQFKNYRIDFSKFRVNTDSIKRPEGGIVSALEFKVGNKYLIVTEDLYSIEESSFLKSTIQSIGLIEIEKKFMRKLPRGYLYNRGGTSSLYLKTRFEAIISRLKFWRS